jgi:hypothetical protein
LNNHDFPLGYRVWLSGFGIVFGCIYGNICVHHSDEFPLFLAGPLTNKAEAVRLGRQMERPVHPGVRLSAAIADAAVYFDVAVSFARLQVNASHGFTHTPNLAVKVFSKAPCVFQDHTRSRGHVGGRAIGSVTGAGRRHCLIGGVGAHCFVRLVNFKTCHDFLSFKQPSKIADMNEVYAYNVGVASVKGGFYQLFSRGFY